MDLLHLRTDLEISRQTRGAATSVIVKDAGAEALYQFSEQAFALLQRFEGGRSVETVIAEAMTNAGDDAQAVKTALINLIYTARNRGLLTATPDTASASEQASDELSPLQEAVPTEAAGRPKSTIFFWRLKTIEAGPRTRSFARVLGALFQKPVLIAMIALIAGTVFSVAQRYYELWHMASALQSFSLWPVVGLCLLIIAGIHELGHFAAAERYGAKVDRIGVGVYLFVAPTLFVDIRDYLMVPTLGGRLAIALGGVYFEALCWAAAAITWIVTPNFSLANQVAYALTFMLAFRILINLIPFLRMDGYWVFSEAVGIRNLREKSFVYLFSITPGLKKAWPRGWRVRRGEQALYPVFAALSLGTTIAIVVAVTHSVSYGLNFVAPRPVSLMVAYSLGATVAIMSAIGLRKFFARIKQSPLVAVAHEA